MENKLAKQNLRGQ